MKNTKMSNKKRRYVAVAMGMAMSLTAGSLMVPAAECRETGRMSPAFESQAIPESQNGQPFQGGPQGFDPGMGRPQGEAPQAPIDGQNGPQGFGPMMDNGFDPGMERPQGEAPQAPNSQDEQPANPEQPSQDATQGEAPEVPQGNQNDQDGQPMDPEQPSQGGPQGFGPMMDNGFDPGMGRPQGEAPEAPQDSQNGQDGQQNRPEMPSQNGPQGFQPGPMMGDQGEGNDSQNGQKPQMPGGNGMGGPGMGGNTMPGQGGPGGSSAPAEYSAAHTVTESQEGETYTSTGSSENAVLVDGKDVSLTNVTVNKTGDSNGEDSDFYGINAAVLANNGANVNVTAATVTTDGTHANGVFSYGSGTSVTISDSDITTTGNNSGGLMTTGGASMTANNVTVNTSGNSSAAIRSDRGGGTVVATEGSYTSQGVGSPAIYSTADITVENTTLTATNSEAVVIEGGNSVTIKDSTVSGNSATLNGQSTLPTNVLIYQSMSGDAAEGNSSFTMTGGSLESGTETMFHVTNVTTKISLTDVDLSYASEGENLLVLSADSWGTKGKNGGNATVALSSQTASGDIVVDSVSSLDLTLTDASSYTGAINEAQEGQVKVSLSSDSTWTLTGDSYIDSFEGDFSQVDLNGYKLYVDGLEVLL